MRIAQGGFDLFLIMGYIFAPRKWRQYMILSKQLLVTYLICDTLTTDLPGWRSLINGAAFTLWVLAEYQNIKLETIGIVGSFTFAIAIIAMEWFHMVFFMFAMFVLIGYRYSLDKQERLLFLALQNFHEWQKVVEKRMPVYYCVQQICYRTFNMQLYEIIIKNLKLLDHKNSINFFLFQQIRTLGLITNQIYSICEINNRQQSLSEIPQIFSPIQFNYICMNFIKSIQIKIKEREEKISDDYYSKYIQLHLKQKYSNKSFYNDFLKDDNNTVKNKLDLKNEAYISLLKDIKLLDFMRQERQSTVDTIQQKNRQDDLFNFMLQKHVDVYKWWLDNVKNQQSNKNKNNQEEGRKQKNQNCFNKILSSKKRSSINYQKPDQDQFEDVNLKQEISFMNGIGSASHRVNSKQSPILSESLNVIYFNKKLDKNQYFRVNVVPLLLHEPFLSISFQDVTEFQIIKEKQQREKGIGQVNLQALQFIQNILIQLSKKVHDKCNSNQKKIRQKIVFLKEIVQLQSRTEKIKLNLSSFNLGDVVEEIVSLFPNIKSLNVDNDLLKNDQQLNIQQKTDQINEINRNLNFKGQEASLSCSDLQNYDEEINNQYKPRKCFKSEFNNSLPNFENYSNITHNKKASNRKIPSLIQIKTINEIQSQQFNLFISSQNKSSKQKSEEEIISSHTLDYSNNKQNSQLNLNTKQYEYQGPYAQDQNISKINFSFEKLDNNNQNQMKDKIDYSYKVNSPTLLFEQRQINKMKVQQLDGDILLQNKQIGQIMNTNEDQDIQSSQQMIELIQINQNQISDSIDHLKKFSIFNDGQLVKQVLVGLISIFGEEEISINITKLKNKWYQSIKLNIQTKKTINISENSNTLHTNYVDGAFEIFGVKGEKYDLLKQKLFKDINQIILIISPCNFRFSENKLEIEFYFLKQNFVQ